jgi:hypothetical protein
VVAGPKDEVEAITAPYAGNHRTSVGPRSLLGDS